MRLPSAYQEIEYIESSGTQWIDTGYNTTNDIKIEAEVMFNRKYDSNVLFGTTLTSRSYGDCLCYLSAQGGFQAGAYNTDVRWTNGDANINYVVNYTLSSVTLNGDTKTYSVSAKGNRLTLMAGNTNYSELKLFYFKIYSGTTLVRDLVPCYRKSDDVIGMYDTVNNTFYTNSGTGTFTKGANVEYPPEYKLHGAIQTFHWKRPYEWEPGENTLLYLPMSSDLLDYSGNNISVSDNSGVSIVSGRGYFNGSSRLLINNFSSSYLNKLPFTISFWVYDETTNSGGIYCSSNTYASGYKGWNFGRMASSDTTPNSIRFESLPSGALRAQGFDKNKWSYLVATVESSAIKIYTNGSMSSDLNSFSMQFVQNLRIGNQRFASNYGEESYFKGYMSEFIIENKVRTADEVAKYYNRSKSNYQSSSGGGATSGAAIR